MRSHGGWALRSLTLLIFMQPLNALSLSPRSPLGWERISARDDQNTTIPAPVSVTPSQYWDGNDGPWSSFAVQVGTHAQNVRLFPGTAATTTWTISPNGCPAQSPWPSNCQDLRGFTFNPNTSNTWTYNSIYNIHTEVNLGRDAIGVVGFDDITLGWQGSGGPTVEHTIVFSLNPITYWVGILGIDPRPTNFSNFNGQQASLLQILVNTNTIPSLSYGYTAGNQYRLNKVYGSLTFGGYDKSRFIPTNITFPFDQDTSRDLSVNLHGISNDKGTNLLPDGSINILIDSTVSELWLPVSACKAFEQDFGLIWNDTLGYYLVDDTLHSSLIAQNANVTFTIGPSISGGPTLDIVLPYRAFDLQLDFPKLLPYSSGSSRYFPLKQAANSTQYTLGRTFLQEAYLIADYDRQNFTIAPCTWDENTTQNISLVPILRANATSHDNNKNDSFSAGAIAGTAIGVVAAILLLALAAFFLISRHRARLARAAEAQATASKLGGGGDGGSEEFKQYLDGTEITEVAGHTISELDTSRNKHIDPLVYGYSEAGEGSLLGGSKDNAAEMTGSMPIFEMQGSEVGEMDAPRRPGFRDGK